MHKTQNQPTPVLPLRHSWRMARLCMLVAALLLAQWVGLSHRIAHAAGLGGKAVATANYSSDDSKFHDCTLYDAATAADCLLGANANTQPIRNKAVVAIATAQSSWLARVQLPFLSRAPPALIS